MEERSLFDRLHEALDVEPRPGAYERLRTALASKRVKPQRWPALPTSWPKLSLRLAAVMTVVVLAIAAAAAFLVTHPVADRESPADSEHAIAAYKLMVFDDLNNFPLTGVESECWGDKFAACEADVNATLLAATQFHDDLNRFQAPARFTVAAAQLRRHQALQLSRLNAVLAATRAQDSASMARSVAALVSGYAWMVSMTDSIMNSEQGTVATYIGSVRNQEQNLDQCVECQDLAGLNTISCAGSQPTSCQALVDRTASQVTYFQSAVVLIAAPSSMATKDNRLQVDLAKADTALLTMADALSAADLATFNAARISLQQALPAINADAADILAG
jgi:hypothetical protein